MSRTGELLRKVSIFQDLSEDEIAALSEKLVQRNVSKDAVLLHQDEPGDALYVMIDGRAKVVLYGDSGKEVILAVFKAGDFFGEMALLDNQPRSANVVAAEDSNVLVLKRAAFAEHLQQNPKTALNVLAELSRRLRRADEIIGNLALLDVYGRVARILIDLAKRDGVQTEEGIVIHERPTQQDIASMIGTSRETVSRALSEFQKRGFLEMRGKTIVLSQRFTVDQDPKSAAP